MRFIISQKDLLASLNKIQNVVSQKPSAPLLANILLEAREEELLMTTTDLIVGIRCFTPAKILEKGATTIPARRFVQLVRELTAPHLEIETNEKDITEIRAETSRFKIHGMSRREFPDLPELKEAFRISLSQKELYEMLYRTAFSAAKEDNRYALTGVCIHLNQGKATFIGTDGKRLAKSELPLGIDPSIQKRLIIPLKAVEEIMKNLSGEGSVNLYFMPDKIAVESGDFVLTSKLLIGDYPDVNRLILENPKTALCIHKNELFSLLRQISLFTSEERQAVRFCFEKGELSLSAQASEIGEGSVSMPVNYHGKQLTIGFNPAYFLDILKHTKEETIQLELLDSFNPGIIKEKSDKEEQSSSLFLLMPMRLD